jgi:MFS family permease
MLGIVLSMELIGMSAGSIFVGSLADRVGRRPVALGCLVVMAIGMGLATTARDVTQLSAFRLFTGIGIGGLLAAGMRWPPSSRTRAGGTSPSRSWRPAIRWAPSLADPSHRGCLPRAAGGRCSRSARSCRRRSSRSSGSSSPRPSPTWRTGGRPTCWSAINGVLRRLGHTTVTGLPAPSADAPRARLAQLFTPALARTTVVLTVAYFAHLMTFYFILKWIPKIVVDMGFAPSMAGGSAGVGQRRRTDRRPRAQRADAARRCASARDRGHAPRRR